MSNPLEMPINDEARDEAHVASTGGRLCKHKKTKRGSSDAS